MSNEELLTQALAAFENSDDTNAKVASLLLAGAVLPRCPQLPEGLPGSPGLLGLAHAIECAQWETMYDIANSTHKSNLEHIAESLDQDLDDMDPMSILGVAMADQARPDDEKVIWGPQQQKEFTQDFYEAVNPIYSARMAQALIDYFSNCDDEYLQQVVFKIIGEVLVDTAKQMALARVQLFMEAGLFKTSMPQFISPDAKTIVKDGFIMAIGGMLYPMADPETNSKLVGWRVA